MFSGSLPKQLGDLVNLKDLQLQNNRFTGAIVCSSIHALYVLLTFSLLFAGELPKELPVSLEVLILGDSDDNTNKFTGGIPSEWGLLTNLKRLEMIACGLGGEICMLRTTYESWRCT